METTKQTYYVSLANTLLICFGEIMIFFCTLFFSYAMFYIIYAMDGPWGGKALIIFVALSFTLIFGLYPLIICWNYYLYDKDVLLMVDKVNNEITYQNKNYIRKIKINDIIRLEQYYGNIRVLKMQYYKIILKDAPPITITYLLNTKLWKVFEGVPYKRINKNILWLLRK